MSNQLPSRIQTLLNLPQDAMTAHILRDQVAQLQLNRMLISTIAQASANPNATLMLQNAYQQQLNQFYGSVENLFSDYFNAHGPVAHQLKRIAHAGVDPDITREVVDRLLTENLPTIFEGELNGDRYDINEEIHARVNNTFGVNSQRVWNHAAIEAIFEDLRARKLAADPSDAHYADINTMLLRMTGDDGQPVYGLRLVVKNANNTIITFVEKEESIEAATEVKLEGAWIPHNDNRLVGTFAEIDAAMDAFLAEAGIEGMMDPVETEYAPVRADDPWSKSELVLDVITERGDMLSLLFPKDYPVVVPEGDLTGTRPVSDLREDDTFTIDSRHPEYEGQIARVRRVAAYDETQDEGAAEQNLQTVLHVKLRTDAGEEIVEVSALHGLFDVIADDGTIQVTDVRHLPIGATVQYSHNHDLLRAEVVEILPTQIYANEATVAGVTVLRLARGEYTFHRSFSEDRIIEISDSGSGDNWASGVIADLRPGLWALIDAGTPVQVIAVLSEDDDAQQGVQNFVDAEEEAQIPEIALNLPKVSLLLRLDVAEPAEARWVVFPTNTSFSVIPAVLPEGELEQYDPALKYYDAIGLGERVIIDGLMYFVDDMADGDRTAENGERLDMSDNPPWVVGQTPFEGDVDAEADGLEQELIDTDSEDSIPNSGEDRA